MKKETEFNKYLEEFNFHLPDELIARYPPERRDQARLLHLDRQGGGLRDLTIPQLPSFFKEGDILIRNRTKVSPRRVLLERENGKQVSALLLEEKRSGYWITLLKGARRLKEGEILRTVALPSPVLFLFHRDPEEPTTLLLRPVLREGERFLPAWGSPEEAEEFFESHGEMPIPPYMERAAQPLDRERYQTLFAREPGSVAAPTAGLHFTEELMKEVEERGARFFDVELKIGYGTFAPLKEENFQEKRLHKERYSIPEATARELNLARKEGRRTIAIGTTTLRTLESNLRENGGSYREGDYTTSLFLHPPDRIESIQGLLTNFHLPGSSLLLLVSAFANPQMVREAYRHAIEEKYRFFSYGDAMLIL